MIRQRVRDLAPGILVAALAAAFGVTLLQLTGALAAMISADDVTGSSSTVKGLLSIVAIVFIVIAVYVSAVVTANTVATVIAGRTRTIALLRLIGSTAHQQRVAIAREGLLVGAVGAVIGAVAGTGVTAGILGVGVASGSLPSLPYSFADPLLVLPIAAVVVTTWLASWSGSRRVLVVSPLEAAGASTEARFDEAAGRRGRNAVAATLVILGAGLLAFGVALGLVSPFGVLIGLVGGVLSFTGVVLSADRVMPPVLRLVGRLFSRTAAGHLAAENALRYPERSARSTIGLVIGVTLVTMFAVVVETYTAIVRAAQAENPDVYAGVDTALGITVGVFSVLLGFSALIAAVGLVNTLSLSVYQRTRELGLLRALGFSAHQVRALIRSEAAQLTLAALATGLALGVVYGWAGAQSLLGSMAGGLVAPAVPWWLIAVIAVAGVLLTTVATVVPARRATRVPPVVALAVD